MAKTSEQWVDEIETAMTAILTGGVSAYSLAGRSFTKHDLGQLQDLLDYHSSRVASKRFGITTTADLSREQWGI